jgi:hypothetical protein
MAEMLLTKDHDVIEAVPPDRIRLVSPRVHFAREIEPKSGDPVCPSL